MMVEFGRKILSIFMHKIWIKTETGIRFKDLMHCANPRTNAYFRACFLRDGLYLKLKSIFGQISLRHEFVESAKVVL